MTASRGDNGEGSTSNAQERVPTHWSDEGIAAAAARPGSRIPLIDPAELKEVVAELDAWDMWQLARPDGSTVSVGGRTFWFFLAAARQSDPEGRHDVARIRLTSRAAEGWTDHGWVLPEHLTPGTREWSGCSILDGDRLTLYFTAAGRRGGNHSFEQRLFEAKCRFQLDRDQPVLSDWTMPLESVAADGNWYKIADQATAPAHGIWGFRDPAYFQDPANGAEHLIFAGSAGWTDRTLDGVIGLATRVAGEWKLQPPIVEALGTSSELERPHIVIKDGRYYLFWSTHARRFAPATGAPSGLYGMVADSLDAPWRPINGSTLVAANPPASPMQAYCWWVTGEGEVMSFVDYPGFAQTDPPTDLEQRRGSFGGTIAPRFRLQFDGDAVVPIFATSGAHREG
ncbi:Levansucrase [Sphingobium chlorophenolicum L-1]|uniref:Levansucrase n=1 Tax=Sphingobium chlorophenolicum L-1 TaxID=690566 RepID=F6EZQ0_SPHCR|nr:glycoside hydrolase family 68 protein [Sphingobium chlorophenolicum]AEG50234.1 Levansucrase [Sphingobium chlorophenolicum L-1]